MDEWPFMEGAVGVVIAAVIIALATGFVIWPVILWLTSEP
jgi:hypothetical protein